MNRQTKLLLITSLAFASNIAYPAAQKDTKAKTAAQLASQASSSGVPSSTSIEAALKKASFFLFQLNSAQPVPSAGKVAKYYPETIQFHFATALSRDIIDKNYNLCFVNRGKQEIQRYRLLQKTDAGLSTNPKTVIVSFYDPSKTFMFSRDISKEVLVEN